MSFTTKLVFLDIDGVLNSYDWAMMCELTKNGKRPFDDFDPAAVARLRRIVSETGAEIVVSSTWRLLHSLADIRDRLADAGYPRAPILSKTPSFDRRIRGAEVLIWRQRSKHAGPYVCLDDAEQFYPHQPLVRTHFNTGLTDRDASKAINILNNWALYAKEHEEYADFEKAAGERTRKARDNTAV